MDWEPEMKRRYYDEVEAEVNGNGTLGMGDPCSSTLTLYSPSPNFLAQDWPGLGPCTLLGVP